VAFKLYADLAATPSTLTNAPDAFLHYYVARYKLDHPSHTLSSIGLLIYVCA
jgi:hypothetical protein